MVRWPVRVLALVLFLSGCAGVPVTGDDSSGESSLPEEEPVVTDRVPEVVPEAESDAGPEVASDPRGESAPEIGAPGGGEDSRSPGGRIYLWTTWKRPEMPPRGLRHLWRRIDGLYIQAPAGSPTKPFSNPERIVRAPGDRGEMTVADQHAAFARWYVDFAVREGADRSRLGLVIAPNGTGELWASVLPSADLRAAEREIASFGAELMYNLDALGLPKPEAFHLDIEIGQQVGSGHERYTAERVERIVGPALRRSTGVERVTNYRSNNAPVTYDFRGQTTFAQGLAIARSASAGDAVWVRPDQLKAEEVRELIRAALARDADVILFNPNMWVLWDRVLAGL